MDFQRIERFCIFFKKGPPGQDGKDGKDGEDGQNGKDGQPGLPGPPGKYWEIISFSDFIRGLPRTVIVITYGNRYCGKGR